MTKEQMNDLDKKNKKILLPYQIGKSDLHNCKFFLATRDGVDGVCVRCGRRMPWRLHV